MGYLCIQKEKVIISYCIQRWFEKRLLTDTAFSVFTRRERGSSLNRVKNDIKWALSENCALSDIAD
jgi:hypothetical protein